MARLNETVIVKNDDLLSTIEKIDSIIKENENVIIIISTGVYTNLVVFRSDIKFFDELYEREFNSNAMDLQYIGKRLGVKTYVDPCLSFMDNEIRIVEI